MPARTTPRWNHNIAYHRFVLASMPQRCRTALDIGCGDGMLALQLAARAGSVIGVDPDPASIRAAREQSAGHANVSFMEGDFLSVPLAEGGLDFVSAVASLHHMPIEPALSRAGRLLSPGGKLAVVGLARAGSPVDYMFGAAGVAASRAVRVRRGWWEHSAPTTDPSDTYDEVRRLAHETLAGCTFRRRLYFRYTITWTRPNP